MGFLAVALVLLLVFVLRFLREPRRVSNGIYLVLALMFLALWVLTLLGPSTSEVVITGLFLAAPLFVVVLAFFLVANGLKLFRREGRRLANALTLAAGIGLFAMVAAVAVGVITLSRVNSGAVAVAVGTMVLLTGYVGFVFTAFLLYSVVYGRIPQRPGHVAIIVLGASVRDGVVRPLLASRLDRALALYRRETEAGFQPLVVTSGGRGADEPAAEADVMADYLRDRGVPDGCLLREGESTSTQENVRFSKAMLADQGVSGRVLVVTSNYHVLRAAILTRRLGVKADVRGARTARYFLPNAFIREFVALIAQYRVANAVAAGAVVAVLPLLALST